MDFLRHLPFISLETKWQTRRPQRTKKEIPGLLSSHKNETCRTSKAPHSQPPREFKTNKQIMTTATTTSMFDQGSAAATPLMKKTAKMRATNSMMAFPDPALVFGPRDRPTEYLADVLSSNMDLLDRVDSIVGMDWTNPTPIGPQTAIQVVDQTNFCWVDWNTDDDSRAAFLHLFTASNTTRNQPHVADHVAQPLSLARCEPKADDLFDWSDSYLTVLRQSLLVPSKQQQTQKQQQQQQQQQRVTKRTSHQKVVDLVVDDEEGVEAYLQDTSDDGHPERPKSGAGSSSAFFTGAAFKPERWQERYDELVQYRSEFGDCLVPHNWNQNTPLAQWVKRQRYQFKLKKANRHTTLTDERMKSLDDIGFVWRTHDACWAEKFSQLEHFVQLHGHCKVPCKDSVYPGLAVWIKCQRHQFQLFSRGNAKSTMTQERVNRLLSMGFSFASTTNKRNML
jgi:Helicase associated domain